jgi:hypothetical protein
VEADINLEFEEPKDYVPPVPKTKAQMQAAQQKELQSDIDAVKMSELADKHRRIDGQKLTRRQKESLLAKVKEEEKKENPDFDPR